MTRRIRASKMARNLVTAIDNTPREGKNQTCAKALGKIITYEKFECTDCQFLPNGHSHYGQDQRFSEAATVIAAAPILEDMHEFADWIK